MLWVLMPTLGFAVVLAKGLGCVVGHWFTAMVFVLLVTRTNCSLNVVHTNILFCVHVVSIKKIFVS